MIAKLVTDTTIPGAITIIAETPAEAMILRIWSTEKRPLTIEGYGGSILEDKFHLLIGFADDDRIRTERPTG